MRTVHFTIDGVDLSAGHRPPCECDQCPSAPARLAAVADRAISLSHGGGGGGGSGSGSDVAAQEEDGGAVGARGRTSPTQALRQRRHGLPGSRLLPPLTPHPGDSVFFPFKYYCEQ